MKLLIIIDQEGCSNITPMQSSSERTHFMIAELENFIYTVPSNWDIDVLDCHNNGLNVFSLQDKFPKIKFIPQIWNFNINANYTAAVLIGFHSAYGTQSPFAHTFRTEIVETLYDGENVGEVTLLTKWLLSNHIPVLFIHGEPYLEHEVKKLDIPFVNNISRPDFQSYKCSRPCTSYQDISFVKIRLINNKFLDAFPSQLFKIENNYIVFNNINHYMLSLSEVSIFLNAARNYYLMYIKRIFNHIKWHYTHDEILNYNDERLNSIFNKKNIFSITQDDIAYLKKKLSS